ncbi:CRISPR-associated protein CasA/Cse1, type TIGR02547 [Leptospira fainei serovar Hurstbridge str. BUT 6]|uniref:CRISPR-associated protein CasA/Cse1, type TIGR02547 n=1 Tax=Leptospira fainei serovar Hurstbridge str. BUT 6 TaxID=1193011 RepID=S3UXP9_9LEPT|nr:type I-E CRISPR-associated protein Cse1/CasA [Leptospira fainei]EPG75171.1 CRISPR-associated protein CasA/Cse1, type TIGR02547 [Leptospira fainei serovar Hurstbridge str. BUT 6]
MPQKKAVAKKKTQSREKAKEREQTDFSFNLLTEPWLPVISLKKEKQFLNLNEFLKNAHTLERFDFPLPGLETAVIRFLVALVHIVGAPETLKEWEEKLSKGKFEEGFIKELNAKYSDKLDLFSKKDPFMQEANLAKSEEGIDGVDRLISFFPYATNQIHWNHKFAEQSVNLTAISCASAVSLLLFSHSTMMAGGAGYKPGINGVPPLMILLKGTNLYNSIFLNVLNGNFVNSLFDQKYLGKNTSAFPIFKKGEISSEKINLQMGLLWKSRDLLLMPERSEEFSCSLSGRKSNILIKNVIFNPQSIFTKKDSFWHDPTIIKIDAGSKGIKKMTTQNRDLPAWKEYPSLINTKGRNGNKRIFFPPLVIQQLSTIQPIRKRPKGNIMIFSLATDNKAKIFEISENEYFFNPTFIDNEDSIKAIEGFVNSVEQFQWKLQSALKIAYKIRPGSNIRPPSFEAAYWHEIGSNFEEALERLSIEDDINLIQNSWNELLANHVWKTFYKHTEKLILNPKNLKQYQAGNQFLEKQIQNVLLKHKRKAK